MGPLEITARQSFFHRVLAVQTEINEAAERLGRPKVDFLNDEEIMFIRQCWDTNLWPNGWTGKEPNAGLLHDEIFSDGSVQSLLFKDCDL